MNYVLKTFAILAIAFLLANCNSNSQNKEKAKMEKSPNPQYVISVKHGTEVLGDITIELFADVAPKHVHNFDSLVAINFFDGTAFHRCIPGFMIQGGDPNSKSKPKNTWGYGDPSQTKVPAEFSKLNHKRGIISAARSQDPNSASSQFFICVADASYLDGQYTIFGQVLTGMEVADKIVSVPKEGPQGSAPVQKVEMTIKKK